MRLPDDYLACIAYLGWPTEDRPDHFYATGTGFFVEHEGSHHIVTAAHVAVHFLNDHSEHIDNSTPLTTARTPEGYEAPPLCDSRRQRAKQDLGPSICVPRLLPRRAGYCA